MPLSVNINKKDRKLKVLSWAKHIEDLRSQKAMVDSLTLLRIWVTNKKIEISTKNQSNECLT